jgi:hypothetical protein
MLQRFFWSLCVLYLFWDLINAQNPPPVAPPPGPSPTSTPGNNCNPFMQTCPNPDCVDSSILGLTLITSPNSTSYQYVGVPILVNWTYSAGTDNRYPLNSVNLYYRYSKDKSWTPIAQVNANRTSFMWNLSNVISGSYEVRFL